MSTMKVMVLSMKKKYKFTNKTHPPKAVMGSSLGGISLVSLILVLYKTYSLNGDIPSNYGVTGFLIMSFSFSGLLLACHSLNEKECYTRFVWIGIILNSIVFLAIAGIVVMGMYD